MLLRLKFYLSEQVHSLWMDWKIFIDPKSIKTVL